MYGSDKAGTKLRKSLERQLAKRQGFCFLNKY